MTAPHASAKRTPTKLRVSIITPASARANTGNWHTAARWARFLRAKFGVSVGPSWPDREAETGNAPDVMIALHARRSAASIAAFANAFPDRPLIVVLTGTDLYRDIRHDADARRSLQLATRLVVLNELGARALPPAVRHKVDVILQSAPRLAPAARSTRRLLVAAVGHLRDEKDPALVMRCARAMADPRVQFVHIGAALVPDLGRRARTTAAACARYRWLGGLARASTRQWMRRAHLLLHPSKIEGGAQAIVEAITAGTPVLASDIEGNVGLLGAAYPGLFPAGDTAACVRLLERAASDAVFYRSLVRACRKRAPLFDPRRETTALIRLVDRVAAGPVRVISRGRA